MNSQFLTTIPIERVLYKAIDIVSNSNKVIRATMLIEEDIDKPLSRKYHQQVQTALMRGCIFKRLAFGSQQELDRLPTEYKINSRGYQLRVFPDVLSYQRLLIGDKRETLFKIEDSNDQSLVCYTKFEKLIEAFIEYFESLYRQAESLLI